MVGAVGEGRVRVGGKPPVQHRRGVQCPLASDLRFLSPRIPLPPHLAPPRLASQGVRRQSATGPTRPGGHPAPGHAHRRRRARGRWRRRQLPTTPTRVGRAAAAWAVTTWASAARPPPPLHSPPDLRAAAGVSRSQDPNARRVRTRLTAAGPAAWAGGRAGGRGGARARPGGGAAKQTGRAEALAGSAPRRAPPLPQPARPLYGALRRSRWAVEVPRRRPQRTCSCPGKGRGGGGGESCGFGVDWGGWERGARRRQVCRRSRSAHAPRKAIVGGKVKNSGWHFRDSTGPPTHPLHQHLASTLPCCYPPPRPGPSSLPPARPTPSPAPRTGREERGGLQRRQVARKAKQTPMAVGPRSFGQKPPAPTPAPAG